MIDDFNIRIAFSRGTGVVADLIRKFSGSDINHCLFVYFDPVFGMEMTLGANANGLTKEPRRMFGGEIVRQYMPLVAPSLVVGLRKLADWLNKPYDLGGLLGMAHVEVMDHVFHHIAANPLLNTHNLFCSEFGKMVLNASGYDVLASWPNGSVDPCKLDLALTGDVRFKLYGNP